MGLMITKLYIKTSLKVSIAGILTAVLVMPAAALAFSGFGNGTQGMPYRISTCAQLNQIANNLSGYYVLNNNINCGGITFTPIGSGAPFTGTLDGQDHTITNINFTTCGLFCETNGATIENLSITDGSFIDSTYADNMGTFVGTSDGSTLTNLHSDISLTGSAGDEYIGGIAGLLFQNTTTITDSSFTGSITVPGSGGYVGGIAGITYDNVGTYSLSNDYAAANITLTSGSSYQVVGGFIGAHQGGTITNSYSAGSITSNSTSLTNVGGFAGGFDGASIQNSFSATVVNGNATVIGAVYGYSGGTNTNMYFDESRATRSNCSGDSQTTCTAVNASNSNPYYFFDNKTNEPLNSWDFNNTWSLGSSYPTLKSETAFVIPDNIPNNGDADNDGLQDAYEPNVLDIEDTNGAWATVTIPSSDNCIIGDGQSITSTSIKADSNHPALTNPVDFNVYCLTAGETVPITIIYDRVYTNPSLVFYNTNTQTYTPISGAQFSTVTFGGVTRTKVTYSATDGGAYDSDGIANGIIADPVGLVGPAIVAAPNTGYDALITSNIWETIVIYSCVSLCLVLVGTGLRKFSSPRPK